MCVMGASMASYKMDTAIACLFGWFFVPTALLENMCVLAIGFSP